MNYLAQLLTKEWKSKRMEILIRDNHECVLCKRTNYLQVHHRTYISGRMAWQYDNSDLITLCRKCHFIFEKKSSVLKTPKKKPIPKTIKPDKNKIKELSKRLKILSKAREIKSGLIRAKFLIPLIATGVVVDKQTALFRCPQLTNLEYSAYIEPLIAA